MRRKSAAILTVLIALLASPPVANALKGYELLDMCSKTKSEADSDKVLKGMCIAYIAGVRDLESILKVQAKAMGRRGFCVPEGLPPERLLNVVMRKLRKDARDPRLPAAVIILKALDEAFPCR